LVVRRYCRLARRRRHRRAAARHSGLQYRAWGWVGRNGVSHPLSRHRRRRGRRTPWRAPEQWRAWSGPKEAVNFRRPGLGRGVLYTPPRGALSCPIGLRGRSLLPTLRPIRPPSNRRAPPRRNSPVSVWRSTDRNS